MKIRFIAQAFASERERNGNVYSFVVIRSTVTAKSITIDDCSLSNARCLLNRLLNTALFYPELFSTESVMPKKDWKDMHRTFTRDLGVYFEHHVTADVIHDLETV